ncbi:MAG: hypothetical protein VX640_03695 [Pseudomonadota bacterium]|nr:hypothetical protein [Pseudomonadota bacterium]
MSALENAVQSLAGALDALEARLDERLSELAAHGDFSDAARRQARAARAHAGEAAETLAGAIGDLRALLGESKAAE